MKRSCAWGLWLDSLEGGSKECSAKGPQFWKVSQCSNTPDSLSISFQPNFPDSFPACGPSLTFTHPCPSPNWHRLCSGHTTLLTIAQTSGSWAFYPSVLSCSLGLVSLLPCNWPAISTPDPTHWLFPLGTYPPPSHFHNTQVSKMGIIPYLSLCPWYSDRIKKFLVVPIYKSDCLKKSFLDCAFMWL